MADYYPLISRAVANLGTSTPEQRRELYTRATNALVGQLRMSDPPIPEADITRERLALEEAIGRVETEVAGGVTRTTDPAPEPVPAPVPATPSTVPEPIPPQVSASEDSRGEAAVVPAAPVAAEPPPATPVRATTAEETADQLYEAMSSAKATQPEPLAPADDMWSRSPREEIEPPAVVDDAVREVAAGTRPRPQAPRLETRDRRWIRAAVIGLAIAVVVGLTATAAIMLKHQPADFAPQSPAATASVDAQGKTQDRLPGEAPATPAVPGTTTTAAAPVAAPTPAPAPSAPAPGQAAPTGRTEPAPIGILQRVLLVEEPAEGTKEIRQTPGRVRWRLDNVSGGAGEPLDAAVRAEIEVPDAALKADLLLRRNRDAALPASHTLELKFVPSAAAPNGAVRDVGVPEMRQDETMRGAPLAGIAVPVTENLFLTGLSNLSSDVQRNIDLLKGRNWFMVPLRFANGRRAVLLIEKGPTGSRTIADAVQAWQQS
ncbi:hypothetical protein [Alsobacter sp. R-9]